MRLDVMKRWPWICDARYVQEQAVGAGQGLFVVRGEFVGDLFRKQIERGPADDFLARQPELGLGHPIGQDVTAIAQVLDGDLRRDVIDDLAQERIIAVALLLQVLALRGVFDRGDPSALRQRLVDDQI